MALINNSNLPSIQRVKYEDYKDAPGWFAQFLNTLNLFMTGIYNIVNGGITYNNLGVCKPFSFTFTRGSTIGFTFSNPLIIPPNNVILGNVYETGDTRQHPTQTTTIYWHFSQGKIFVDDIIGLTDGVTYVITVAVS